MHGDPTFRHFATENLRARLFLTLPHVAGYSVAGIPSCGTVYWVLEALNFLTLGCIEWFIALHLIQDHRQRVTAGFPFLETDIRWEKQRATLLPTLCSLAGVGAGWEFLTLSSKFISLDVNSILQGTGI